MSRASLWVGGVCLVAPVIALSMAGCPGTGIGGGGGTTFNIPPIPIISADVTRGVAPLTVSFNSDQSTDDGLIVSREWDFGDGATSPDIRPTHTYPNTGSFTVRLTLTDDDGATASRTLTISVTQAPVAVITVDQTSADSAPAIFNFDASGSFDPDGSIASYNWDFDDGSSDIIPTLPHTFSQAGTFRVRLTVTDNLGITDTDEVLISVGIPTPAIAINVPGPSVENIVVSPSSSIWVQGEFSVATGVPRMIRAGLDGDRDLCESQTILASADPLTAFDELSGHTDAVSDAAYAPDGSAVATSGLDGTVRIFSAASGVEAVVHTETVAVHCVAYSPDGTLLAYGLADGSVIVRSVATGAVVQQLDSHTAAVNDVDFSPNSTQLISGSSDRRALVWSVGDGTILRDFAHDLGVNAVAFSKGDPLQVATGSADSNIRLWNVESGAVLATLSGHTEAVTSLAYTSDGLGLLSGSLDNTARLWSPFLATQVQVYSGHTGDVLDVGFSPDGQAVITGSGDGTVRTWESVSGSQTASLQPCSSPIVAVGFSPDGASVLAGIAARNDIKLDTDPPNGNDLNISYPRELVLQNVADLGGDSVPTGQYFLWVELDTDRTDPVRAYADATINVIEEYTSTISSDTPMVPLINDVADVVVPATQARKIFDIGQLQSGDRLKVSLLTQPGYSSVFADRELYSVMVLDSNEDVFAWFQSAFILFTPDVKLVAGTASNNHYVVVDGPQSVRIEIEREFGLERKQQRVFIDYRSVQGLRIGDISFGNFDAFDAADLNPAWGDTEEAIVKAAILSTVQSAYADWNVVFSTSDDAALPEPPFVTMHVVGNAIGLLGIADYIDPRNDTFTGRGITFAIAHADAFPGETPADLGVLIGCTVAHETGHLLGLRHVDNPADIMDAFAIPTGMQFLRSPLAPWEQFNAPGIGFQNAPKLFDEIFGPP